MGIPLTRTALAAGNLGFMEPTATEEPTTRRVAVNALVPVALTLLALTLIWRASVGPVLHELGWITAGGVVSALAIAWSGIAMLGAVFGLQRRPGDTAIAVINGANLVAWITLFDGAV
jgi:hypothetical protein